MAVALSTIVDGTSPARRRTVCLVLGVAAAAATAGSVLGWYARVPWYDDATHAGCGFAITLAAGWWLDGRILTGSSAYPVQFVGVLVLIGLGFGAGWELLEFGYEQLTGAKNIIPGHSDTILDLLCDGAGGLAAAFLIAGWSHR